MKNEDESNINKNNNLDKNTDTNDLHIKKDFNILLKDFAFFKNDILKELKNLEFKIDSQRKLNTDLRSKISSQDSKLSKMKDTLDNVTSVVNENEATTNYYKEKINKLLDFKRKNEDNCSSLDYKLRLNSEDLKNAINKYDKIIYENLIYPGVLGRDSKFRDLRELLDYVLDNIKIFSAFKDKNEVDLKTYKIKLDSMIQSINFQISGIMENANAFTLNNVTSLEKRCMDEIRNLDEKVMKIRVSNMELDNKMEKEKNKMLEEWENVKKSKDEMSELFDLSLKKLNNNNTNIQKTLDNFENRFNEIKENIASLNELYNKMIKENNEEKHDYKINSTKSDYFKSAYQFNEKSNEMKRVQSAKTFLQKYIEGNSYYDELIEKNNQKCLKHESSESSMQFLMRKYYDEGYNYIKDINIIETIEDIMNKNNPLHERVRINRTMNPSPVNQINSNHSKYKQDEQLNDFEFNNAKRAVGKIKKNSPNKKFILLKDGNVEDNKIYINNKKNKSKSKEADKKIVQPEKFPENFMDKSRLAKLKILSNISFLYDDIKKKQFPKIENNEVHKNEELFLKTGKIDKSIKNKMNQLKQNENNIIPILKNTNINKPKTKKIKNRVNSSEIIQHNNIKEENKDISIYKIKENNQELMLDKNKKLDNLLKTRKSHENIKKPTFKLKLEKNQ